MLVSHRGCVIPALRASVMDHSVLHPHFRMVVSVRRNVTIDDGLFRGVFPRRLDGDRANLLVALEGPLEVRLPDEPGFCIEEGGFLLERRDHDWGTRIESSSVMLVVEWADDVFGRVPAERGGKLGARWLRFLRQALGPVTNERASDVAALAGARRALNVLRAAGVPLPPFAPVDLREPVLRDHARMTRAIDLAVASFVRSPRSADLEDELGWSSRHVTRRLSELNRRYGFNATGGIRDVLGRWRIYAGTALMTAPDASTENVARLMGYASPPAFCKAFAQHGLPSPGNVSSVLRASR
jgi:AraC-like DNA-binding protein